MKHQSEIALLQSIARDSLTPTEYEHLRKGIAAEDIDWGYLSAQISKHQLLELFLHHVSKAEIPIPPHASIDDLRAEQARRTRKSRMLDELCEQLANLLSDSGIIYAVLKGPALAHEIFTTPRNRSYSDIDILVRREDVVKVSDILNILGYQQGSYDHQDFNFHPASKEQKRYCALLLHHLFPFVKREEDYELTVEVHLDLFARNLRTGKRCFNIDLSENSSCWSSLGHFRLENTYVRRLSLEYFLLHLCLHTYGDQIGIERIAYGHNLVLRDYCDIRELLAKKGPEFSWPDWVHFVKNVGAQEPVFYVLFNLQTLYPELGDTISDLLWRLQPADINFMNEFGLPWEMRGKQRGKWSLPFLERLFQDDDSSRAYFKTQAHLFCDPNYMKLHESKG